ncbi:type 1 glutamine amidotransferase domain-containing protein [soil metagenome]
MGKLDGKRIAFLQTDGVEQVELVKPLEAIKEEGAEATLVSLEEGEFQGFDHLDKADTFTADLAVSDADACDFDLEAGVLEGRTVTSFPSLKTDIRNAGGKWVDEEVHVDEGLITSRTPDDLPAFIDKAIEEFCEGEHEEQARSVEAAAS